MSDAFLGTQTVAPNRAESAVTLAAAAVTKTYSAEPVLCDVSIDLRPGEIHAIVGENGAGKSTLINILSGTVRPTAGDLKFRGESVRLATPHDALALGISVVHQEFISCPSLSVTENLFLGQRLPRTRVGTVDWKTARRTARDVLGQLGVGVDVRRAVSTLSPEQKKLVEISRSLVHHSSVLILDEPTAALPADESARLFTVLRQLRERGVAIAYVSHRLDEVLELCDRISVLRDGRLVAAMATVEATVDDLVRLMVGRPLSSEYPRRPAVARREGGLEISQLTAAGAFREISFAAAPGEIVGVAGLDGSGRSELLQAIAGDRRCAAGKIILADARVGPRTSLHRAIEAGIAYVPPDRQHEGLHLTVGAARNVALPLLRRIGHGPLTNQKREGQLAREYVSRLDIRPPVIYRPCASFSGGNQQKVLLAKWLATEPKVLLLDEPTRGVDVGAKSEIHALIRDLAASGTVIVLASTDMPELLGLTDRIVVLRAGLLSGVFDTAGATAEDIGRAATAAPERAGAV